MGEAALLGGERCCLAPLEFWVMTFRSLLVIALLLLVAPARCKTFEFNNANVTSFKAEYHANGYILITLQDSIGMQMGDFLFKLKGKPGRDGLHYSVQDVELFTLTGYDSRGEIHQCSFRDEKLRAALVSFQVTLRKGGRVSWHVVYKGPDQDRPSFDFDVNVSGSAKLIEAR